MGLHVETDSPEAALLLERHPEVASVALSSSGPIIAWQSPGWNRRIWVDQPSVPHSGLVELCDNNPMVCADEFSMPGLEATLALIGLGPLLSAVAPIADPVVIYSFPYSGNDLSPWLSTVGYQGGVTIAEDVQDLGHVAAAVCMAEIPAPSDVAELDEIFEERFGRSFYVRRTGPENWHVDAVIHRPFALYRLRYTPDERSGLVTIQVMLDRNGKGGAAQAIHAFNVMNGFEESVGIPETLTA